MGGKKKKSSSGPIKKASKYKIPSRFDCPICDAKASIVVKVMRSLGEATVHCRECKVGVGTRWPMRRLEKPVDIFFRFNEQLLQQDRQDVEQEALLREIDAGPRLSGGEGGTGLVPMEARHDEAWVSGTQQKAEYQQSAVVAAPRMVAAAPAQRPVATLADLHRRLMVAPKRMVSASQGAGLGQIDLGDDYADEAEGAAAEYFAPRQDVYGEPEDDEYDPLFQ